MIIFPVLTMWQQQQNSALVGSNQPQSQQQPQPNAWVNPPDMMRPPSVEQVCLIKSFLLKLWFIINPTCMKSFYKWSHFWQFWPKAWPLFINLETYLDIIASLYFFLVIGVMIRKYFSKNVLREKCLFTATYFLTKMRNLLIP